MNQQEHPVDGSGLDGPQTKTAGLLPAEPARKKFTRRGTRSEGAKNRRRQKYIDSGGPARARKTIERLTGMALKL